MPRCRAFGHGSRKGIISGYKPCPCLSKLLCLGSHRTRAALARAGYRRGDPCLRRSSLLPQRCTRASFPRRGLQRVSRTTAPTSATSGGVSVRGPRQVTPPSMSAALSAALAMPTTFGTKLFEITARPPIRPYLTHRPPIHPSRHPPIPPPTYPPIPHTPPTNHGQKHGGKI